MTEVIHIRDMKPGDIYIGRAKKGSDGYFGNPFYLSNESQRTEVVSQYVRYFYKRLDSDPEFKERILALKGKRLVCFCTPKLCHGNVIAEWLDNQE